MGLAFVAGIIAGVLLDKTKKNKTLLIIPGIAASCLGSLMMYFTSPNFIADNPVAVLSCYCVGSFVQSMGSSIVGVVCLSSVRNLTPPDKVGRFQGIRMVFVVMLPMVVGSIVSGAVSSGGRYIEGVDEFGHATYTCPPVMFLLAAIVVLLAIVPTVFLLKADASALTTPAEGVDDESANSSDRPVSSDELNEPENQNETEVQAYASSEFEETEAQTETPSESDETEVQAEVASDDVRTPDEINSDNASLEHDEVVREEDAGEEAHDEDMSKQ